jgi:hypothetical protein
MLMVVPSTADRFRAAIRTMRSLDGKEGVRILVKKLGRVISESVEREELELLDIYVQGFTQLRSGRRDQEPAKDRPPTPHFILLVE